MKSNLLVSVLITYLIAANSYAVLAQDSTKVKSVERLKYGIGLGAGFTTGYGISFKYLPKRVGFQINFAPYKDKQIERHSVGLTFIYTLIETKKTNLYLYQGNHYYYNSYYTSVPSAKDSMVYVNGPKIAESYVNNGVGLGVRIFLGNRAEINFMTGYAAYDNFNKINLTGEASLYYRF